MAKVIKNKSVTARNYFGTDVPASSNHTIEPEDLVGFQEDDALLDDVLNDSDIVMAESADLGTEYDGALGVSFLIKPLVQDAFVEPSKVFYSDSNRVIKQLTIGPTGHALKAVDPDNVEFGVMDGAGFPCFVLTNDGGLILTNAGGFVFKKP